LDNTKFTEGIRPTLSDVYRNAGAHDLLSGFNQRMSNVFVNDWSKPHPDMFRIMMEHCMKLTIDARSEDPPNTVVLNAIKFSPVSGTYYYGKIWNGRKFKKILRYSAFIPRDKILKYGDVMYVDKKYFEGFIKPLLEKNFCGAH
jgi:hypothetical protein